MSQPATSDEPAAEHRTADFARLDAVTSVQDAVARWMARPCTRTSFAPVTFGAADDAHGDNLHLRLCRVRAANGELGIHLLRISVPPAWRRRGCATHLLDIVLYEARKARFAFVIVVFVVSPAMEALLYRRVDFASLVDPWVPPDSYISRLN